MTGFKWELPMWCPQYGQVKRIEKPDNDGDRRVFFEDGISWYYCSSGEFYNNHHPERRLRNGIMPGKMPQPDEPYVTINENGAAVAWSDRQSALADQRDCGGVVVDLVEAIRLGAVVYPPKEKTVWLNFDRDGRCQQHSTKQEADRSAFGDRIACKEVTFIEGEGL